MGDLKPSYKALRDYAFTVLKNEVGGHYENGIWHLSQVIEGEPMTDDKIRAFVNQMPEWQLDEMYRMIYGSEMEE